MHILLFGNGNFSNGLIVLFWVCYACRNCAVTELTYSRKEACICRAPPLWYALVNLCVEWVFPTYFTTTFLKKVYPLSDERDNLMWQDFNISRFRGKKVSLEKNEKAFQPWSGGRQPCVPRSYWIMHYGELEWWGWQSKETWLYQPDYESNYLPLWEKWSILTQPTFKFWDEKPSVLETFVLLRSHPAFIIVN